METEEPTEQVATEESATPAASAEYHMVTEATPCKPRLLMSSEYTTLLYSQRELWTTKDPKQLCAPDN